MKFIYQLCIILLISFIGEVLRLLIPLPIPASIYGLVIMLVCLKTHIIRIDHVDKAGSFLLEIMPLLFIPAAVGLLVTWDALRPILLPVAVISVLTTVIVMAVTGKTAELTLKKERDQ